MTRIRTGKNDTNGRVSGKGNMSEGGGNDVLREAIAAAKAGDRSGARLLLALVTQDDPRNELAWIWRASLSDDPIETISHLEKALAVNNTSTAALEAMKVARLNAGVAAAQAGKREAAREWLRQACEDNPASEVAWMWRAGVTDDPTEALAHLDKVLEINPANERAKTAADYYRARLQASRQWYCPICQAKSATRFIVCPDCRCVLSLANSDEAINNFKSDEKKALAGIARLEASLLEKPEFATHYYIGMALLNLQRFPDSLEHFRAARELNPDNEFFAQHLAVVEKRTQHKTKKSKAEAGKPAVEPPAPVIEATPEPPRKCVIVADASPTMCRLLRHALTRAGYRVLEATDGGDVRELLRSGDHPDAAVLDVDLPGEDGYALCKQIRQNPETAGIPVILLSEKDGIFDKSRGKKAGMTVRMSKPFPPDELARVVRQRCPAEFAAPNTPVPS